MRTAAAGLATACVLAGRVAAAAVPPVHLTLVDCPRLDEAETHRAFAADLGTREAAGQSNDVTEATVRCEPEQIVVRVRDPLSRKVLQRTFGTISFEESGASRLVGIAASELVLASWAELSVNPAPKVPADGPAPSRALVQAAREAVVDKRAAALPAAFGPAAPTPDESEDARERRELERTPTRLLGVVSSRAFVTQDGALWGGGLRLGQELPAVWSWAADALVEDGAVTTSAARFGLTSVTLGGWLTAYRRFGAVTVRLGGGLRVGVLRSASRSDLAGASAGASLAPWGWPLGVVSTTLRSGQFVLDLSAEAGYVVFPLRGSSEPDIQSPWFSGQLGLGFVL